MKRREALIFSVFLMLALSLHALGNSIQETQTARATYDVGSTEQIVLEGKNVIINVVTGQANKVSIVAIIDFNGKETDKIRDFLDNFEQEVQKRITQGGGRLYIDADLDEPFKISIGRKSGVRVGYNDEELKITYNLTVPATNSLSIKNSYQDVSVKGSYTGDVSLSLYSANFEGEAFNKLDLELKFGKAEIQKITEAEMKLYEQKLEVQRINDLKLQTKFSKVSVKVLGTLKLDSYESKLEFDELGKLEGLAKFGRISSGGTISDLKLDTYEVDLEFGEVGDAEFTQSKFCEFRANKVGNLRLPDSYEDSFVIQELGGLEVNSKFNDFEIQAFSGTARIEGYETDIRINSLKNEARLVTLDGKFNKLRLNAGNMPMDLKGDMTFGDVEYPEARLDRKVYIKENNKLEIELVSRSGTPKFSVVLKGYETKAEIL